MVYDRECHLRLSFLSPFGSVIVQVLLILLLDLADGQMLCTLSEKQTLLTLRKSTHLTLSQFLVALLTLGHELAVGQQLTRGHQCLTVCEDLALKLLALSQELTLGQVALVVNALEVRTHL